MCSRTDVFWTYDTRAAAYLDIHARESFDGARTWSEIWSTGVPGQPAPPTSLGRDQVALVYVDRTATPKIKLRTSADGGRTWPPETELVVDDTPAHTSTAPVSSGAGWAEQPHHSYLSATMGSTFVARRAGK